MRILVVNLREFQSPQNALISTLVEAGHNVTVVGYDLTQLPASVRSSSSLRLIDFGSRETGIKKHIQNFRNRKIASKMIKGSKESDEVVWCIGEITVREVAGSLCDQRYIVQLYELLDYVPAFGRSASLLHSKKTKRVIKQAWKVVVPEINRAHIQKVLWDLPELPAVLPNKPYDCEGLWEVNEDYKEIEQSLKDEKRKILLYQGVIGKDRDLRPIVDALERLDENYALYMMGSASTQAQKNYLNELLEVGGERVRYLGYVPSPGHLAFTKYGYIGLMPYKPNRMGYYSILNALYCAPNKVWEYSHEGLPMIGSNVAGLDNLLSGSGAGLAVNWEPDEICEAVNRIDRDYQRYSGASREFYKSINLSCIVSEILED